MRRAARALGPGRIRVLGGVGGLLACGAAGVAVAVSPKPADAPLKPPVDPAAPLGGGAHADVADTGGLVIPATPVCGAGAGLRSGAAGTGAAGAGAALDPSLRPVIAQLRAAPTRAQRMAVLQALSPDQRQQVVAYLRSRARAGGQATGGSRCTTGAGAGSSSSPTPGPVIQPDVVDGGPSQPPMTNSYVS